jgi:hypothetical protein
MLSEREIVQAIPRRAAYIYGHAKHAAGRTDGHVIMQVGAAIAAITQTIPSDLKLPWGTSNYHNLYILLIGESSETRKTEAVNIAHAIVEAAIPNAVGENPGSWEGLIDSLRERPQQLLFWGEFSSALAAAQRGYLLPLKNTLTEAYDGRTLGRNTVGERKAGRVTQVKNPRLSILAAIDPFYLERLTEEVDWRSGFLGRFLTFWAPRERLYEDIPMPDLAEEARLAALLASYSDSDPWRHPVGCSGLAPEARDLARGFSGYISRRLAADELSPMVKAAISRSRIMVPKAGAAFEWDMNEGARHGEPWTISAEAFYAGTRVVECHLESATLVGEFLALEKDMRDRRRVLQAIGAEPTPLGKVLRKAQVLKAPRTNQILDTLCEEGAIVGVTVDGGMAGAHYMLNPSCGAESRSDKTYVASAASGLPS